MLKECFQMDEEAEAGGFRRILADVRCDFLLSSWWNQVLVPCWDLFGAQGQVRDAKKLLDLRIGEVKVMSEV